MPLAILFHFLCTQHVSDINISIISGIRVAGWSTTCASACKTDTTPTQPHWNSNTHRTKNNTINVVIQQNSRKLLMMDILMSETCWAHKKWNKIASDIKLVFYSTLIVKSINTASTGELSHHTALRRRVFDKPGLTTFINSAYHVDNWNQSLHPTEAKSRCYKAQAFASKSLDKTSKVLQCYYATVRQQQAKARELHISGL